MTKDDAKCRHPDCSRLALETCQWCYNMFCPFHIAKLHIYYRTNKTMLCKSCYESINGSHNFDNYPDKYPPFPEYTEDEKPGDKTDG